MNITQTKKHTKKTLKTNIKTNIKTTIKNQQKNDVNSNNRNNISSSNNSFLFKPNYIPHTELFYQLFKRDKAIVFPIRHTITPQSLEKSQHKKSLKTKPFKFMKNLNEFKTYNYEDLNKIHDNWNKYYSDSLTMDINYNVFENEDGNKLIKKISEGYARGVSAYIMKNYKLGFKISNGFCKLWEMFHLVKDLFPLKQNPKIFFVAEAPGQWIFCSNLYYFFNYIKKNPGKPGAIDWFATTLNPHNKENIAKYGPNIFSDNYGFMKKYKEKWVFGKDDTGDITKSENQRWSRNKAKELGHIDLITGDAGTDTKDPLIFQKLDFAEVCMVASLSSIGGNCVIKHFLSYIRATPITYNAFGSLVNYLYLYYLMFDEVKFVKPLTSNPNSGEFYVIGKGFKGISDSDYDKLMTILDNFQVNACFFEKKDIPESFVQQVADFSKKILNINIFQHQKKNLIQTCFIDDKYQDLFFKNFNFNINDKNKKYQCSKYANYKILEKMQQDHFEKWIKDNDFQV